jgi:hypothetical protein
MSDWLARARALAPLVEQYRLQGERDSIHEKVGEAEALLLMGGRCFLGVAP